MNPSAHSVNKTGYYDEVSELEQQESKDVYDIDASVWSDSIGLFGASLVLTPASKYEKARKSYKETKQAFDTVNDINIAEKLLDLERPEQLTDVFESTKTAKAKIEEKNTTSKDPNKILSNRENQVSIESKPLLGQKETISVTTDRIKRVERASILAKRVHRRLREEEIRLKIDNACRVYGISDRSLIEKEIKNWQQNPNNKSVSFETVLEKSCIKLTGTDKSKQLKKENKNVKNQALENIKNSGYLDRAKEAINQCLDGNQPLIDSTGFKGMLEHIDTPLAQNQTASQTFTPISPSTPTPSADSGLKPLTFNFGNFKLPNLSSFFSKFSKPFSNFGSIFKKGLSSLGNKLSDKLGKLALHRAMDAVAPGLGKAWEKVNEIIKNITGIDISGLVVKGVYLTVITAIAIPIVFILLLKNNNIFSPNTAYNPYVVKSSSNLYSWKEFEKNNLSVQIDKIATESEKISRK